MSKNAKGWLAAGFVAVGLAVAGVVAAASSSDGSSGFPPTVPDSAPLKEPRHALQEEFMQWPSAPDAYLSPALQEMNRLNCGFVWRMEQQQQLHPNG